MSQKKCESHLIFFRKKKDRSEHYFETTMPVEHFSKTSKLYSDNSLLHTIINLHARTHYTILLLIIYAFTCLTITACKTKVARTII